MESVAATPLLSTETLRTTPEKPSMLVGCCAFARASRRNNISPDFRIGTPSENRLRFREYIPSGVAAGRRQEGRRPRTSYPAGIDAGDHALLGLQRPSADSR